jgi:hypothetical protein
MARVIGITDEHGIADGCPFGRLDNGPLVGTDLRLGDELAMSYQKAVEHREAKDFEKQ